MNKSHSKSQSINMQYRYINIIPDKSLYVWGRPISLGDKS